jgi:hypothetical protein
VEGATAQYHKRQGGLHVSFLVFGIPCVVCGLWLCGPWIISRLYSASTAGQLSVIHAIPTANGNVQLVPVFEFDARDKGGQAIRVLGNRLADRLGYETPLPPLPATEATQQQQDLMAELGSNVFLVLYNPSSPSASARLCRGSSMFRYHLGLAVLATPPLAWGCSLLWGFWRLRRARKRSLQQRGFEALNPKE